MVANIPAEEIMFVSLGMFIIDTIVTQEGKVIEDIIGGAGTFAALGARLVLGPQRVGFIVDYGNDTPESVEARLDALAFQMDVRRDDGRKCTRGLNTYENDVRHFEYLTPKSRITAAQLNPAFLKSKSFHLICTPSRCIELVRELKMLRNGTDCLVDPLILWEPVPDSCVLHNREAFSLAVKCVDIVSPNMDEAAGVLGRNLEVDKSKPFALVEEMAQEIREMGIATVIIRCAGSGAFLRSSSLSKWFPAFIHDQLKVVDATGAGNTFCGAFVSSIVENKANISLAMAHAAVAAGLAIQQIGLPRVEISADNSETWNGRTMHSMLAEYIAITNE